MFIRNLFDKEADYRWSKARRAAHWRNCAHDAREASGHTRDERASIALMKIARDYDFLADYEEKSSRSWL